MIIRYILVLCIFLMHNISLTQSEDNIWYTGTLNGGTTQGGAIDFNLATPSFVGGSYLAPSMAQAEGTASRCDVAGNLLFYTDGVDVWGANHVLMPNGTGLGGHRSSRFSALNVPDPGNTDRYYVFTNDGHTTGNGTGLHYSHIDMTLNAGIGDVIIGSKAISLLSNTSEDLTGALHCNGADYWVIVVDHPPSTGNSDMHIYAYQVTSTGILAPVVSNLGAFGGLSLTDMFKMSPDGTKGVIRLQGGAGWTDLVLDFDNQTGVFSINATLNTEGRGGYSPNGQFYYVSKNWSAPYDIVQYDASNMMTVPTVIAIGVGPFQDFRIGPDGKLYICKWGDVYSIDSPNAAGIACNYAGLVMSNPGMMGGPSLLPNVFLKNTGISSCVTTADSVIICAGDSILTDGSWVSTAGIYGDTIVEILSPVIDLSGPFCTSDASVILTGSPAGGTWAGTGIIDPVSGEFSPTIAGSGTHQVTYTVSDSTANSSTTCVQNAMINVLVPDDSTFNYAQSAYCIDDLNPNANVIGLAGGVFSINNGGVINNSSGQIDLIASGVGVFSVTYTTNGPCPTTSMINVTISGPTVDLGPDEWSCNPAYNLDAGNPGSSYVWQDGSANQTLAINSIGTYWVEVTDLNGCSASDTIVIFQDTILVNLGEDTVLCNGASYELDAGIASSIYSWQDGSSGQTYNVNSPGTYWVNVQNGSCSGTDSIVVEYETLIAEFSPIDTAGCAEFEVDFTDLSSISTGSISNWLWGFGDNSSSTAQNPNHLYASSGDYNTQLLVTSVHGCTAVSNGVIFVYDAPVADFFTSPTTVYVDEEVQFTDQSYNNVLSWNWQLGGGATSSIQNPVYTFSESADYEIQLIVSNDNCSDTVTRILSVNEELLFYVPNSFSPDGDEFNNAFQPIFTSGFDPYDYELNLFNRWGEKVFESHDVNVGWDGTYKELVQDGTYVWVIEFKESANDRRRHVVGHVNVLR